MKKEILDEYYFSLMGLKKSISIDKKALSQYLHRIQFIDTFTEIMKDIYIFTNIQKYYPLPSGNKLLYTKKQNNLILDTFEHELIFLVKESDGINLFTGCGHSGVTNMIQTVREKFPNENIKAVIGGFHLISIPIINFIGSKNDIDIIAKIIKKEKVQKIYTGHCTGKSAFKQLRYSLGDIIEYLRLGMKIEI